MINTQRLNARLGRLEADARSDWRRWHPVMTPEQEARAKAIHDRVYADPVENAELIQVFERAKKEIRERKVCL